MWDHTLNPKMGQVPTFDPSTDPKLDPTDDPTVDFLAAKYGYQTNNKMINFSCIFAIFFWQYTLQMIELKMK